MQWCSKHWYYLLPNSCCKQYEYLWADGVKYKKPVRLSAPEYVDKLFDWIEDQVRTHTGSFDVYAGLLIRQV